MPMYSIIEYSDNYSKTSGNSLHYYRDESFLNVNSAIADFPADDNNIARFKFKGIEQEMIVPKSDKIIVPLKYLRKFRRTLGIPIINLK